MVRMYNKYWQSFRMYESKRIGFRNESVNRYVKLVRISKSSVYETPYNVTGIIKLTGLKELPKLI